MLFEVRFKCMFSILLWPYRPRMLEIFAYRSTTPMFRLRLEEYDNLQEMTYTIPQLDVC